VASVTLEDQTMKAIAFPLVLTLAAGMAAANEPTRLAHKSSAGMSEKKQAAKAEGEIVSIDGDKLVLKTSSGEETFTASGKAASKLRSLHSGERVVVKAHDNELISVSHAKSGKHHRA
jgi:hypothetical protein